MDAKNLLNQDPVDMIQAAKYHVHRGFRHFGEQRGDAARFLHAKALNLGYLMFCAHYGLARNGNVLVDRAVLTDDFDRFVVKPAAKRKAQPARVPEFPRIELLPARFNRNYHDQFVVYDDPFMAVAPGEQVQVFQPPPAPPPEDVPAMQLLRAAAPAARANARFIDDAQIIAQANDAAQLGYADMQRAAEVARQVRARFVEAIDAPNHRLIDNIAGAGADFEVYEDAGEEIEDGEVEEDNDYDEHDDLDDYVDPF